MADVFDYFTWRGDLSFTHSVFNEVDGMILARLSYFPFEYAALQDTDAAVPAAEAARMLLALPDLESKVLLKTDVQLLKALSENSRFHNARLFGFVNQVDRDTQAQFSAITIRLDPCHYYISYRGTDNTLIGWKEDFNMSFQCPVPAQELAVQYLNDMAAQVSGSLMLGGHSKGGNLAVYAAAYCDADIQSRIDAVYNFDGPGFDEKILQSDGYARICSKVSTFVPQSSIVGMLLGHEEQYTIVHSTQVSGIWQHDIYSWEVERDHFLHLQTVNNSSRFVDFTLKQWLANMDKNQREQFVDAIYTVMSQTEAHTLRELSENWFESAKIVLKSINNLDKATRKAVSEALVLLAKCAKKGAFEILQSRQDADDTQKGRAEHAELVSCNR